MAPDLAQGPRVEPFGFECMCRRGHVLLGLANAPVLQEQLQEGFVRANVERRELHPHLEVRERFFRARSVASHELLEHGDMAGAKAPPLRQQPCLEMRAAVELEPFEKIAGKPPKQRTQPRRLERRDPRLHRMLYLQRVDRATRELE